MAKRPRPAPAPESADVAALADAVAGLTDQVRQLALILDEVREDLIWAVRNDRFNCAGHSEKWVASHFPDVGTDEVDDEGTEQKAPVVPPPVRETGTPAKKTQSTLFS